MVAGNGDVDADTAAASLVARIGELTVANAGRFIHAKGDELPW